MAIIIIARNKTCFTLIWIWTVAAIVMTVAVVLADMMASVLVPIWMGVVAVMM